MDFFDDMDIFLIEDQKSFGNHTVRRINMDGWEVLEGRTIVFTGTDIRVAKYLNENGVRKE